MTKILFVGDVHAVPNELDECKKLMDFVAEIADKNDIKLIIFLGDIFHTHAVIRVEVLNFWIDTFLKLGEGRRIVSLVGNHDMPGSKIMEDRQVHSLCALRDIVDVVEEPEKWFGLGLVPYTHDSEKFVKWCKELYERGVKETLIAHQTFVGAMYENNFPAPDGVDQDLIPQNFILSGHIHKQQQIGKVKYLGSPRWRIKSDANEPKCISIIEFDENGKSLTQKDFSTSGVCREIREYSYTESEARTSFADPPDMDPKHKNFLTLIGSARWINKEKKQWQGIAEVRSKVISEKRNQNRVRESEGIQAGMKRFVYENFSPALGVSRDDIWKNITAI